jgi:hypothetical protein
VLGLLCWLLLVLPLLQRPHTVLPWHCLVLVLLCWLLLALPLLQGLHNILL